MKYEKLENMEIDQDRNIRKPDEKRPYYNYGMIICLAFVLQFVLFVAAIGIFFSTRNKAPAPTLPATVSSDLASVAGKRILVTGTNRGLGFELVKYLAQQGAQVVYTTRQSRQGQQVGRALKYINNKGNFNWIPLDLNNDNNIMLAADKASKYAPYDIVVQNAAIMSHNASEKEFEKVYRTNVEGTIKFQGKMLPLMKDYGRVVMLSSEAG